MEPRSFLSRGTIGLRILLFAQKDFSFLFHLDRGVLLKMTVRDDESLTLAVKQR